VKPTIICRLHTAAVSPALETSTGRQVTAPHTFFDEPTAQAYAELAARLNPHDDPNAITWPRIAYMEDAPPLGVPPHAGKGAQ